MNVKIFRIEGVIVKPNNAMFFSKEIRAVKREDALEKVYADLGSQHRVKRVHVKVASIKEIFLDEAVNPVVRELSGG